MSRSQMEEACRTGKRELKANYAIGSLQHLSTKQLL